MEAVALRCPENTRDLWRARRSTSPRTRSSRTAPSVGGGPVFTPRRGEVALQDPRTARWAHTTEPMLVGLEDDNVPRSRSALADPFRPCLEGQSRSGPGRPIAAGLGLAQPADPRGLTTATVMSMASPWSPLLSGLCGDATTWPCPSWVEPSDWRGPTTGTPATAEGGADRRGRRGALRPLSAHPPTQGPWLPERASLIDRSLSHHPAREALTVRRRTGRSLEHRPCPPAASPGR